MESGKGRGLVEPEVLESFSEERGIDRQSKLKGRRAKKGRAHAGEGKGRTSTEFPAQKAHRSVEGAPTWRGHGAVELKTNADESRRERPGGNGDGKRGEGDEAALEKRRQRPRNVNSKRGGKVRNS